VLYTQHIGYAGHVRQPRRYRSDARPVREDYDEQEEEEDEYVPQPEPRRPKTFQKAVEKAVAERMAAFESKMRKEFGAKAERMAAFESKLLLKEFGANRVGQEANLASRPAPAATSTDQADYGYG